MRDEFGGQWKPAPVQSGFSCRSSKCCFQNNVSKLVVNDAGNFGVHRLFQYDESLRSEAKLYLIKKECSIANMITKNKYITFRIRWGMQNFSKTLSYAFPNKYDMYYVRSVFPNYNVRTFLRP